MIQKVNTLDKGVVVLNEPGYSTVPINERRATMTNTPSKMTQIDNQRSLSRRTSIWKEVMRYKEENLMDSSQKISRAIIRSIRNRVRRERRMMKRQST